VAQVARTTVDGSFGERTGAKREAAA